MVALRRPRLKPTPPLSRSKIDGQSETIKIKQIGSPIRRPESQKKILVGLGLDKMHKVVERQDTPEVRGAIAKIPHLVAVVD